MLFSQENHSAVIKVFSEKLYSIYGWREHSYFSFYIFAHVRAIVLIYVPRKMARFTPGSYPPPLLIDEYFECVWMGVWSWVGFE